MSSFFASSAPGVTGANSVPKPQSDDARNAAPEDEHKRVVDFIKESPAARYTFDSRNTKDDGRPTAELCRLRPDGGVSCIKLAVESAALFKSMQSLGFFCALPAEPHRTHMECNAIAKG
ncbi:hypothetical protein Q8F55_002001 [Vanrija albida]|uniref:Uncharacterized protein n=1 Tax=Vanrija albida TaxID=181172 RepID=A0ABR3Q8J3_9TREE